MNAEQIQAKITELNRAALSSNSTTHVAFMVNNLELLRLGLRALANKYELHHWDPGERNAELGIEHYGILRELAALEEPK